MECESQRVSNSDLCLCGDAAFDGCDPVRMQELVLQCSNLREVNAQLQMSLESEKEKVKQAMAASKSVLELNEQLKRQLEEAEEEKEKLSTKMVELEVKLKDGDRASRGTENSSDNLVCKMKTKVKELKNVIETEKTQSQSLKEELETYKNKVPKVQKQIGVYKSELEKNTLENEELKKKIVGLNKDLENSMKRIETLDEGNKQLETQNLRNEKTMKKIREDNSNLLHSLELFNEHFEKQLGEICTLNNERNVLIDLINKAHCTLCVYETKCMEYQKKNEILTKKLQNFDDKKFFDKDNQIDFNHLVVNCDGDIKTKCSKIGNMENVNVEDKIQMLIDEFINEKNESQEELDKLKMDYQEEQNKSSKMKDIIISLINEIRNIIKNEKVFEKYDNTYDDILSYISPRINEFSIFANTEQNNYNYFSSDINDKKKIVLKNMKIDDNSFLLFSSQFIIDELLRKQLESALIKFEGIDNVSKKLNCEIEDLPELFEKLKQQNDFLEDSNRKMKTTYKQLLNKFLNKNTKENQNLLLIEKFKIENNQLKEECNLLKFQLDVAKNNLPINKKTINQKQINELEKQKVILSNENMKLSGELLSTTNKYENELKVQKQKHITSENKYKKQINLLNQTLSLAEDKIIQLKKKIKRNVASFNQTQSELMKKQNEIKASYETTNNELKDQLQKSKESAQQLTLMLNQSQESNENEKSKNKELSLKVKTIELNYKLLEDKISKERLILKNQISAHQMKCNSQIQTNQFQLKEEFSKEKEHIFDLVISPLKELYNIESNEINEEFITNLILKVQKDVKLLQFIQKSDTLKT